MVRFVACFALLAATPAGAQSAPRTAVRRVPYTDLDLARPLDVQRLDRRVRSAARAVCSMHRPGSVLVGPMVRQCVAQALRGAAPQVALAVDRARRQAAQPGAIQIAAQ